MLQAKNKFNVTEFWNLILKSTALKGAAEEDQSALDELLEKEKKNVTEKEGRVTSDCLSVILATVILLHC